MPADLFTSGRTLWEPEGRSGPLMVYQPTGSPKRPWDELIGWTEPMLTRPGWWKVNTRLPGQGRQTSLVDGQPAARRMLLDLLGEADTTPLPAVRGGT